MKKQLACLDLLYCISLKEIDTYSSMVLSLVSTLHRIGGVFIMCTHHQKSTCILKEDYKWTFIYIPAICRSPASLWTANTVFVCHCSSCCMIVHFLTFPLTSFTRPFTGLLRNVAITVHKDNGQAGYLPAW